MLAFPPVGRSEAAIRTTHSVSFATHPVIDRRVNSRRGRRADVVVSVVGRGREVVGADGARVGVASSGGDLVAARRRGPRAVVLAHRDLLTGCNQSTGNGLKTATPHAQVCRYARAGPDADVRDKRKLPRSRPNISSLLIRGRSRSIPPSSLHSVPYLPSHSHNRAPRAMIADRAGKGSRSEWSN